MPHRHTPEFVAKEVAVCGHALLTEYKNGRSKITYACKCGRHDVTVSFEQFRRDAKVGHTGCFDCRAERKKRQSLIKWGTEHPNQSAEMKKKHRETCMTKYGVDNPGKLKEFQDKAENTMRERYGISRPMESEIFKEKQRSTLIKNYGVDNPQKSASIKAKTKRTLIERYGVDNPMKHKPFFDKAMNSFERYEYVFPKGKRVFLQGYEKLALDDLLREGYDEDMIVVDDRDAIPVIIYLFAGKACKFYPDIYLPSEMRIIEVKSTFTFSKFEAKNHAKFLACIAQGYNIEYWLYDKAGALVCSIYSS